MAEVKVTLIIEDGGNGVVNNAVVESNHYSIHGVSREAANIFLGKKITPMADRCINVFTRNGGLDDLPR